ncbi:MAG TPA: glucoamylase family protein, partial [Kofleriaceae bacterium]|nr:glucoamylase family protein [Kofleriaceae bacterium]
MPSRAGLQRNRLPLIARWKILDNLRRSLTGPAVLLLLVLGWTWLPGSPLAWTVAALVAMLAPQLPGIVRGGLRRQVVARAALAVVFLAHESAIVVDAIVRVVFRAVLTRRYMLQWTTAAHAELGAARAPRALAWRAAAGSPVLAIGFAALIAWVRPHALIAAAPLLAIWLVAPEIAAWISRPVPSPFEPLAPDEQRYLRLLAHRTWRFFDAFVGPVDQWLPIDNYQAAPHEQTAHRTSPTNIGLLLLSTLSAYDFGYLGASELSLRVRGALDSVARLAHYQGHLLNWYDTRSLQPLLPRYVSTVDSGNFAGCLIALAHGCRELSSSPVVRAEPWQGLVDSIDVLAEVLATIPDARRLVPWIERMRAAAAVGLDEPTAAYPALRTLCDTTAVELDREVLAFVETGALRHDGELLHALREAIGQLHRQLRQMRRELDAHLPWLALADEPAARAVALTAQLRLGDIPETAGRLAAELAAWRDDQRTRGALTAELDASAQRIADALARGKSHATALLAELAAIAARAEDEVRGMDFRLLYDAERKLFRIGYNVTADHLDANHYDLLATEARLASYLAIVRREVPEAHWYTLGRPMTSVDGTPALLSWGGTMFEYLMPNLLMRSHEGTLLARTSELVVEAQIAWGKQNGEPWGISESAFALRDAAQTYQYRSFGVPGLGFKRGLEDDHVVTPYASALAVAIRPRAVVANLRALEAMGMGGMYGLYEALDLTPERASEGQQSTIVHSYMAHHQGMLFVALGNLLNRRSMVDRFHADPVIATGELLLDERAPDRAPAEWPLGQALDTAESVDELALPDPPGPWTSADPSRPQSFVLSNGRLTSLVTDTGGGGLSWHGLALTRFQPDATSGADGVWIYLRDEASRRVWLATSPQGRTSYAMHKIELHRRAEGISVHVDVAVAAADDVEVRQVTLHNETDRPRRLTVTSAGRPVLVARAEAPVHPAFSSMFVVSEELAELEGLLFARRQKSQDETPAVLVHRLVREGTQVAFAGHETDRAAFYGRGTSLHTPAALAGNGPLRGATGAMLDPIMSLMASVELPANGTVALAFVTAVGRSRTVATELARRYGSMHAVRWAFRDAELESPRRLQRTDVEPALVPSIQQLFSGLLFADPTLRGPRTGVRPAKHRLWGRGISGDDPIIVVRVHDASAKVLRETLAAQRYLRGSGQRIDLVLIDEQATGYASEGSGTLRRVLAQHEDGGWIGRKGGIYLLAADQMSDDERRHLEACARVLLDTRDGTLAARFGRVAEAAARLPRFEPTLGTSAPAPERPRPTLAFDNGTGGFTADGREYAIALPPGGTTPAPWCNVLANDQLGCLVSESALGTTWSINSGENKLTPWRNDPVFDTPAEVVYLRDEETAEVWSPTPLPAGRDAPVTVRHGAGYTIFERTSHGLDQQMTVFVPPGAPIKIVRVRIANQLPRHR